MHNCTVVMLWNEKLCKSFQFDAETKQEITTYEEVQQGQESKPFQKFKCGCGKDEAVESLTIRKVKEGGKEDVVYSFKCKKVAKRGGFSQRRYTKLSESMEKCKSDEFVCGAFGKYDQASGNRWTGLECCFGDNIEVSEKEETYEEIVEITETKKEIKSTRSTEVVVTEIEMM